MPLIIESAWYIFVHISQMCVCVLFLQVAAAQEALERGEDGAAERLAAAEEELERALEAVLDAECAGGGGFGGETQESAVILRVFGVVVVVVFLTSSHRHSLIVLDLMTGSSIVTTY